MSNIVEYQGKVTIKPIAYHEVSGMPSFGCLLVKMSISEATLEFGSVKSKNQMKYLMNKHNGKVNLLSIVKATTNVAPSIIKLWLPLTLNPSEYCVIPIRVDVWNTVGNVVSLSSFQ